MMHRLERHVVVNGWGSPSVGGAEGIRQTIHCFFQSYEQKGCKTERPKANSCTDSIGIYSSRYASFFSVPDCSCVVVFKTIRFTVDSTSE